MRTRESAISQAGREGWGQTSCKRCDSRQQRRQDTTFQHDTTFQYCNNSLPIVYCSEMTQQGKIRQDKTRQDKGEDCYQLTRQGEQDSVRLRVQIEE